MKKFVTIALTFFLFIASSAQGTAHEIISDEKVEISIPVPDHWKLIPKIFGFSAVLVGPEKNNDKVTLGISLSKVPFKGFDTTNLEVEFNRFSNEKLKWLEKNNGSKFKLISKDISEKKDQISSLKISYEMNANHFIEKTYFKACSQKLMQIKGLIPVDAFSPDEAEPELDKVVSEIKCLN